MALASNDLPTPPPRGHRWAQWTGRGLLAAALLGGILHPAAQPPGLPTAASSTTQDRHPSTSRSQERQITTAVRVQDSDVTSSFTTDAAVLGDALVERGVVLGPDDHITPDVRTPLTGAPLQVSITRAVVITETRDVPIEHTSRTVDDPNLFVGTTQVVQAGADGLTRTVYRVTTDAVTGAELTRDVDLTIAVAAPVEEVVAQGTKPLPVAPGNKPVEPGTARALGAQAVADHGWGPEQFTCLDSLWTHESGWSTTAANSSSSAYGIPQALPGSKMASAGADWQTNPATQIAWGLSYIAGRYSNPCGAWSHWQNKHWY